MWPRLQGDAGRSGGLGVSLARRSELQDAVYWYEREAGPSLRSG